MSYHNGKISISKHEGLKLKLPTTQLNTTYYPDEKPEWAEDILRELHVIKTLLAQQQQTKEDSKGLYDFINEFRIAMQGNVVDNIFPEVELHGVRIGVSFAKLLYNKEDGSTFDRAKAFSIYKQLYSKHQYARLF